MMVQPDAILKPDCHPTVGECGSGHTAVPGFSNESFKPHSPVIPSLPYPTSSTHIGSISGSDTVLDTRPRPAGSWSATTCIESFPEHSAVECKLVPIVHSGSGTLPEGPTQAEKLASFLDRLNSVHPAGTNETLDRFLKETDAPWSRYNLKLPGTICAICGIPFTGPNQQDSVTRHIRTAHPYPRKNANPTRGTSSLASHAKTWPIPNPNAQDFAAVGSWPYDRAYISKRPRKPAVPSVDPLSGPRLILCDHPYIPHDRLLFLLNNLNPRLYPERANNFFNSLDIVAANLLDRYPDHVLAQGLGHALARLEQLYQLNFSRFASEFSQWNTAGGHNSGASSYNPPSASPSSTSGVSSHHPADAETPSTGDSNTNEEDSGSNHPQNELARAGGQKRKRRIARPLACPIRKDFEVHGQPASCNFEGADNMWGVTKHLKSRIHRQFISLCRICWDYTTSKEEYEQLHVHGQCRSTEQREQRRGAKVAEGWTNLYMKLCPQSYRIPSQYVDDPQWKWKRPAQSLVITEPADANNHAQDFTIDPNASPFLGDAPILPPYNPPDLPFHDPGITVEDTDMIWTELFAQTIREHINLPPQLDDVSETSLPIRSVQMSQDDIDSFCDRVLARASALVNFAQSHSIENRVQESYFSSDRTGENYLDPSFLVPDAPLDAVPIAQGIFGSFDPLDLALVPSAPVPPEPQHQPQPQNAASLLDDLTLWHQGSLPIESMFQSSPEFHRLAASRGLAMPWTSHLLDGSSSAAVFDGLRLRSAIST